MFKKYHYKKQTQSFKDNSNINNVLDYARFTCEETAQFFNSPSCGMSEKEVIANREKYGANELPRSERKGLFKRIFEAFINPFSLILIILAIISVFTDIVFASPEDKNYATVCVIAVMITVSGVLRFVQETKSCKAAEKLSSMITTTACVARKESGKTEIPVKDIVVGDRVFLCAGDMIPADMRIVQAKDLFVAQSALTGESAPDEKNSLPCNDPSLTSSCLAFMGTNVVSGSGEGIVVATGADTYLGKTAKSLTGKQEKTAFERGVNSVSRILIGFMLIMTPVVFLLNGLTKHQWLSAALFAVSIAVGLTPEMLPMIVTACLAKGCVALSRKKVIVKNLNAMQNLGATDILCTDKTGTLTQDKVVLEMHLNIDGKDDSRVLRHAFLNSYYQTGLKNLLDVAIIERTQTLIEQGQIDHDVLERYKKTDEIPFDFQRRRMSVVVSNDEGKTQLITKGAVEEMLRACSFAEIDGNILPLTEELKNKVRERTGGFNSDGMRVLCVAQKNNPSPAGQCSAEDEKDMVLIGYLAFLDPPKESSAKAISTLKSLGVAVKVLTGDNEKVAACVCSQVGIDAKETVTGADIDKADDAQLAKIAKRANVFARLSPSQKERVVRALRADGHTVSFLGDGINDAPAMRAADTGICVDTAVDIAKESADVILLEKDLTVVAQGVTDGRKTYANMIKYIKITASSNFGNMLSVLVASALLPFLPMLSLQLILLNMVYDICCTSLPWDNADEKMLTKPAVWDSKSITRFMLWFGPVSSLFDIITYVLMYFVVCPAVCKGSYTSLTDPEMQLMFASVFQTGWFIESMFTQTLVIHMLRSEQMPSIKNRASLPVIALTTGGIILLSVLPYTPVAEAAGLTALPLWYFAILAAIVLGYFALSTVTKKLYVKKYSSLL